MSDHPKCLITGGMGFIGFNAVVHYARQGRRVVAFDDLSRNTARRNYRDFKSMRLPNVAFVHGDVRDARSLRRLFQKHGGFELVLHLAAQVAVTHSVTDPVQDFERNALGTLNVLEAVRRLCPRAFFIFASTNKVYGALPEARIRLASGRYGFSRPRLGIGEDAALDFHSPYGCSKGCADQYVRDYGRIYGLKTAVFRQSCIYGPWQYGEEDQGWVAWFLIAALSGAPITIYGDGRQVRDILHIDDLLALYDRAMARPSRSSGQIFNAGGGLGSTLSLLELLDWIRRRLAIAPKIRRQDWRPGDQKVYVSDISKARRLLGWRPRVGVDAGLGQLARWLAARVPSSRP
ncbi:MAG TPA: CDP-paratose 2-epimerase [Elusimicrobia bacterium]|nr:CDP-paratose 2-epimerase [Elusimicrobiota bacterium]HBT61770.1 CDP-paratose 2-epimerase [Elusimicrobiota bacterium]